MRTAVLTAALAALALSPAACKKDESKASATEATPTEKAPDKAPEEAATPRPEGPTGTIQGKVVLTGDAPEMPLLQRGADPVCAKTEMRAETILVGDGGGLQNVLVRIKPGTVEGFVPDEPVVVSQVDCMYRPRVQGGVRGQTIKVGNDDETMHNVHARTLELGKRQGTETIMNRAQPAGMGPLDVVIGDEEVVKLKCDSHGWMAGFVVVSDNPYHTVTGEDGSFELEGVPVGEHEVEAWHEFYGIKTGKVTVAEDGTATLDFGYDVTADDPMSGGEE